ncbi:MAG: YeeE/YedE family protein [Burkholderiaceae bacterium]|nr:YeeE/YedE family protein [Burkholderiaceae bacterium]
MVKMNDSSRNLFGLATGVVFGALLRRGGLDNSRTIVGQLTGDDSRVAKTMGSAVAVGALGHQWLLRRGLATVEPKPLNPVALVGGGLLFGLGMAISGYCPGTAAAAAGSGRREGVWAIAGMLAGASTFVATYPGLKKALEAGSSGRVSLIGGTSPVRRPPLDIAMRPGMGEPSSVALAPKTAPSL